MQNKFKNSHIKFYCNIPYSFLAIDKVYDFPRPPSYTNLFTLCTVSRHSSSMCCTISPKIKESPCAHREDYQSNKLSLAATRKLSSECTSTTLIIRFDAHNTLLGFVLLWIVTVVNCLHTFAVLISLGNYCLYTVKRTERHTSYLIFLRTFF